MSEKTDRAFKLFGFWLWAFGLFGFWFLAFGLLDKKEKAKKQAGDGK